jgi:hypothetical protein
MSTMSTPTNRAFDDLRNTLSEYTRMMRRRWRLALIGLAAAGSIAFWYSQYLPRQYRAATIFERRDDVVLRNLISANSPYSFAHLKSGIQLDMTGSRAMADAAMAAGILPADAVSPEGALSNDELRRLDEALGQYDLKATVGMLQSTPSLDVIELRVDANTARIAQQFTVALRDLYIARTRAKIGEVLEGTREFFQNEMDRYRRVAGETGERLKQRFSEFPGIDPTDPTSAGDRLETLRLEHARLLQQKAELAAQTAARENFLQSAPSPRAHDEASDELVAAPPAPPEMDPGVRSALEGLQRDISELMTVRRMTAEHPSVQALYRKLDALYERQVSAAALNDGAAAPETVGPPQRVSEAFRQWMAERPRVEMELNALRGQLAIVAQRVDESALRSARFERLYDQMISEGGELRAIQERLNQEAANASVWREHLTQLARITAAENDQRGTQFVLIEAPMNVNKAIKPRSLSILAMCAGLGLAAAAALVAAAELFDRSFRSIGQVTRVLGVPVLECIGVIPTPVEKRRRRIAQVIWAPVVAGLVMMLATTASLAWASLERPELHRKAIVGVNRALGSVGLPSAPSIP